MAERIMIPAEHRNVIGKKVKVLRREGKLPAIVYGSGIEPTPIVMDLLEATKTLRSVTSATLVNLNIDGEEQLALVRDRQVDRLRNMILHVDFLAVSMGQTLQTTVPIRLIGHAPVLDDFDALVIQDAESLDVEVLPKDLPEVIEVDISVLTELGNSISITDLDLPEGVNVLTDPDTLIAVAVTAAQQEEEEEEEEELLLEGVEPELIERGKQEEEEEVEEE
jgi:large subunit ribosomal protein L25